MKSSGLIAFGVAILVSPATSLGAQGLPGTNLTVTIRVRAVTVAGDTTTIRYSLLNGRRSLERLETFTVAVPATIIQMVLPGATTSWAADSLFLGASVASWTSYHGIPPGDSTPGLTFRAIGLPTIATVWYGGDSLVTVFTDDTTQVPDYDPLNDQSRKTVSIGVSTAPRTLAGLMTRLYTLTDSSCTLGWITSATLCSALRGHASHSRSRIRMYKAAVEADGDRSMPASVASMLTINANYILALPDTANLPPLPAHRGRANPAT